MAFETIAFESEGALAIITLDRPDKLNSFNEAMHRELAQALDRVEEGDFRCLLLTGRGRGFCAGQDLSDRLVQPGNAPADLGYSLETWYNPLIRRLRALPMPVVCAVNGVAAGAGANIALACDIVLAARSAKFIEPFARLGLVPDSGGTWILPRLVGYARASGMALLGEPVDAETAERWGLIWKVIDDAALMDEARALAAHLATQPTAGLARTKRALLAAATNDLDTQLDLERDLQRESGYSEDYREGVAAFFEKRPPQFRGR
ncbi:MAG: 2-(1,2-epoxy-1,2-dihydrophenyl)acetyl-CoA isomerase [Alphaproteobacteria bacterium]|nr:MAG: 2-(1,2-epoxy-1,2-dihydrophenyl)acetyl-CoA isomerase [Alphaproteobacteria bacterium]